MSLYQNCRRFPRRNQKAFPRQQADFDPKIKSSNVVTATLAKVANHERLLDTFDAMKQTHGKAPGPDGLKFADFSRSAIAATMRLAVKLIKEGVYRPGPSRKQPIGKSSGGKRKLTIRNIVDRVISKQLADLLTPALDGSFLPSVYGFRPKRSTWNMMAAIEHEAIHNGRVFIAEADIRDAFDHVPLDDVVGDIQKHIADAGLRRLTEAIIRGHEGRSRTVGLDQGDALSPLMFNLRLHHCLDQPSAVDPDNHPPLLRYADNLVYLCKGVSEGRQALHATRLLLDAAGFELKQPIAAPVDLRTGTAEILGFSLGWTGDEHLSFGITTEAWASLEEGLTEAHKRPNPTRAAIDVVRGWITSWGPAFESEEAQSRAARRIRRLAAKAGFRELDVEGIASEAMGKAVQQWQKLRQQSQDRTRGSEAAAVTASSKAISTRIRASHQPPTENGGGGCAPLGTVSGATRPLADSPPPEALVGETQRSRSTSSGDEPLTSFSDKENSDAQF